MLVFNYFISFLFLFYLSLKCCVHFSSIKDGVVVLVVVAAIRLISVTGGNRFNLELVLRRSVFTIPSHYLGKLVKPKLL